MEKEKGLLMLFVSGKWQTVGGSVIGWGFSAFAVFRCVEPLWRSLLGIGVGGTTLWCAGSDFMQTCNAVQTWFPHETRQPSEDRGHGKLSAEKSKFRTYWMPVIVLLRPVLCSVGMGDASQRNYRLPSHQAFWQDYGVTYWSLGGQESGEKVRCKAC